MKKINLKTIVIVIVMLVVIVIGVVAVTQAKVFISGATSDYEPTDVAALSSEDGKTATISWTSEKESVAKIEYGTTAASLVLMVTDSVATTNHSLTLNQLRPSTNYYYRIRIGDEIFDNQGMPYIFKTKGVSESNANIKPTIAVTPTIVTSSMVTPPVASESTQMVCDLKTDYNKDGTINSLDVMTCKNNGGVVSPSTNKTKTVIDCNKIITDYNSDGVVNSLDRINCLQSQ
jgi:hypothetical protein